jgi:hypothetical protein
MQWQTYLDNLLEPPVETPELWKAGVFIDEK